MRRRIGLYLKRLIHKLRETNKASHKRAQRPTYVLKMNATRRGSRHSRRPPSAAARPESLSVEGRVITVGCRERILVGCHDVTRSALLDENVNNFIFLSPYADLGAASAGGGGDLDSLVVANTTAAAALTIYDVAGARQPINKMLFS